MADFRIEMVTHEWPRFAEVLDLYYDVLYGPFGVGREYEWYHPAHGSDFAIALGPDDALLGSARLLPASGDEVRQVRQVVVVPQVQGQGLGRALMSAIEARAAEQGARVLWLNARHTAFGFYEANGWTFSGPLFESELTGIPHREMRKRLR